jgi:hypothetical protein
MAKKKTIGELLDALGKKRDEISELEKKKKELKKQAAAIEKEALEALDAQETTQGAGKAKKGFITELVMPNVTDWDALYKFIHENHYYHLLHRRTSNPSFVELFDAGEAVPGVEKFTQRKINLRSI